MRGFADFALYMYYAFYEHGTNISLFRHEHDFSGYSIIAKVVNNRIYVPSFMSTDVRSIIMNKGYISNLDVVCDISSYFNTCKAASSSRILRVCFSNRRYRQFFKIDTGKGYGYNGINGVVLDDDFNPLIICCNVYDIVGTRMKSCGPVCFISPRVFSNTDILSKFIVKNIIPNIHNVSVGTFKPSVLITDRIDEFINKPKAPVDMDFNESIYSVLENHLNEIVNEPQGILQGLDQSDTL